MTDEYRVVFSRSLSRGKQEQKEKRIVRTLGVSLGVLMICFGILLFFGIGCAPRSNLSADQLTLIAGTTIDVQPTLYGMPLINVTTDHSTHVTISSVSSSTLSFDWKKTIVQNNSGTSTIEIHTIDVTGTVDGLDLASSHILFLPSWWENTSVKTNERSGIWLSQSAYNELVNQKQTIIDPGLQDSFTETLIKTAVAGKAFIDQLAGATSTAQQADLNLMKVEAESIDWPMSVNGKNVLVPAMRAKGERGTIVVLKNPNNPLVLSFQIYPFNRSNFLSQGDWTLHALGFQVESLNVSGYK